MIVYVSVYTAITSEVITVAHCRGHLPKFLVCPRNYSEGMHSNTHKLTHITILWPFFQDYPGEPVPEEMFWTMVQGKISEADPPTLTVWLGATPSGLISNPPPSSPIFMPDALPAATLPIYPGFGQASDMLACIPSGLVHAC